MLPDFLDQLFWDTDLNNIDLTSHAGFVISRILEKGSWQHVNWLFKNFSQEQIKQVVSFSHNISQATANLWHLFFDYEQAAY